MDVFLSVLSVAGIILGAVLLIMIISLLLSAILYESVFGKRFEIYDSAHLPDLNDYKGLVNEPVTFPSKRGYKYTGFYYHDESYDSFRGLIVFSHGIFDGQLSYLPSGRTKFIRAKHLGDKFDKAAVLATLQANAEREPKAQFKQDTIGKLIDIQSKMTEGKGIGYKRWLTKHNLKVMAQTVKLLQEKGLTDEDALNQRIAELETKYHDSLAVVKDLEGRMKANKELRYHVAAYTSTKSVAQQLKTAKRPAVFEEQHRAELTAYRAAAAYFKANNITKLPSPKKLEAEYAQLASEKAKFYEQYKETKEELLKLKTAKQNVASFFREEEQTQQER